MSDLSRRSLLGGLGATFAASAAVGQASKKPLVDASAVKDQCDIFLNWGKANPILAKGTFPPFEKPGITIGDDGRRTPANYSGPPYAPRHASLVYVRFEIGTMKVRHAHYEIGAVDTPVKLKDKFAVMRKRIPTDCVAGSAGENFDSWTFGSQSRIYMILDNETIKFDQENLIQFAWFSARKIGGARPTKSVNNCFLNPIIDTAIFPPYEILIFENWYCDSLGNPVQAANHEYFAMNIHLKMETYFNEIADGFNDIPLVLDPDTGNMGSYP